MKIPKSIYPVARMEDDVLLINEDNLIHIGKEKAFDVLSVAVELRKGRVQSPIGLEKHLKFNPWEEIKTEDERTIIRKLIETKFSDADIEEKIIKPLEANKIS